MNCFCTYFDQHYLPKGLALYQSLKQHCPIFKLWILCLDQSSYNTLTTMALPEVALISLEQFEEGDTDLQTAKQNRSRVEYYFTCTPSLPLFILNRHPDVDLITYLDADLFFFSSPTPIFKELEGYSIGIIAHKFPPKLKKMEEWGIYNVGWLSFRRDQNGLDCLRWWRERCIEWCYDRLEADRFADQKYLDCWPQQFANVIVLQHKGANVAPWNLDNYQISLRNAQVWVDNEPLVFYHFQGLRQITLWLYESGFCGYDTEAPQTVLKHIYQPYLQSLLAIGTPSGQIRSVISGSGLRWYKDYLWTLLWKISKREYIFLTDRYIFR